MGQNETDREMLDFTIKDVLGATYTGAIIISGIYYHATVWAGSRKLPQVCIRGVK